ncbi:hypothetical protein MMC17_008928 [Xylographa soralifera]|nr:hypothetical protein [Xylographa soralifera]
METEMINHFTSPNISYFPLPSLYASLPEGDINLLEKAFALVVTGAFIEADRTYERLPPQLKFHSVVTIGRSTSYLQQWRFRECYAILEEALSHEDGGRSSEEDLLIRTLFAYVNIVFLGSFVLARECMREIKSLVKNVCVKDITDIQIYCLREYLRLVQEATSGSPNLNREPLLDIIPSQGKGLLGVARLRVYLQSSGRWREAIFLQDFEEDLYTDIDQKVAILQALLDSMKTSYTSTPLRLSKASKHWALANFYDELKRPEQAGMEIQQAEQLCHSEKGTPHPFFHNVIRLCRLKIDAPSIEMIDAEAVMVVANSAKVKKLYRAELLALQMMNAILTLRQRVSSLRGNQLVEVRGRLENRLLEIGNIRQLYESGILHHHLLGAESTSSLNWWKQIDEMHPAYNIWQHRITRQIELSSFLVNCDEYVPALEARQRAEDLLEECDAFWAPFLLDTKSGTTISMHSSDSHSAVQQRWAARKTDYLQKYFFEDFQKRDMTVPDPDTGRLYYGTLGTSSVGPRKAPFETLLSWILADLSNHELSPSHLGLILGFKLDELSVDECEVYVKCLNASHLIGLLYGPLDNPVTCERWQKTFTALQSWLISTKSFPEIQQQHMLVELQKVRIDRYASSARHPLGQAEESRRALELINSTEYGDSLKDTIRLFTITCQQSFAQAVGFSWARATNWTAEMEEYFSEALTMLRQALDNSDVEKSSFRAGYVGSDEFIRGMIYFAIGALLVSKFEAGGGIDIDRALISFRFAEVYFRVQREASLSRHGFKAVNSYLKALEHPLVHQIFPMSIQTQSTADSARRHEDRIWKWVQTAKCRGLGSLGRFHSLDDKFTNDFLVSRDDGEAGFGVENLRTLSVVARSPVIFIDWYTNFYGGEVGIPIMSAWRAGEHTRLFKFGDDVDNFDLKVYKRHFISAMERDQTNQADETRKPDYWLQKFSGLMGPVFEISDPGDVLVFSPCGLLHGIPLHAIRFDGQPLIRRNPVVYTTSMKSLFYAAVARAADMSEDQSFVFRSSVFGDAPSVQGRESVEKVASIFKVESNTEAAFTKGAFIAGLSQDLDLLHYHAHATTQSNEPLDQRLEFFDSPLSVRDILDIVPKTRSYHATILGCSSGVTVKTTSNEPLGLVPALMYNGAASVVSALWPIDDHDAALFADQFYSDFIHHHEDVRQGIVPESPGSNEDIHGKCINLALATQKAVLRILDSQDGRTDLKHWAGFVLSGWWMLDVPEKTRRKGLDLERFPEMQSAKPWPPPPPAPPIRVRSWLMMVPRWFSAYTLWPYFEW